MEMTILIEKRELNVIKNQNYFKRKTYIKEIF